MFQEKTVCYQIWERYLSVNSLPEDVMGCSLAILPNQSQEEQTEMFKSYQRIHESSSFSLMTFRGSRMLIFSHPYPVREVLLGLGHIQGHSVCLWSQEVSFHSEAREISKSKTSGCNHALLGILLVPFLLFQVLCHPTGRVESWTCSAPGIRTKSRGAFFFSLSVLDQAGSIMGVGWKQRAQVNTGVWRKWGGTLDLLWR